MKKTTLLVVVLSLLSASSTNAALIPRGAGMHYDTVQDITWLTHPSYYMSGQKYSDAINWINTLSYYDKELDKTFIGCWRLPYPTTTFGGLPGELGYLYYATLDNESGEPFNPGPFAFQENHYVWEMNMDGDGWSHAFDMSTGTHWQWDCGFRLNAIAVAGGDIGIPEPSSLVLLLIGGLVSLRRQ